MLITVCVDPTRYTGLQSLVLNVCMLLIIDLRNSAEQLRESSHNAWKSSEMFGIRVFSRAQDSERASVDLPTL